MKLLKESPDNVSVNGVAKVWSSRDAVCFSLIDGICVYEPYSSKPGSHDFLIAALFHIFQNGEQGLKEINSSGVMVKGSINESAKQQLKPLFDSILSGKGGFKRDVCMKLVPNLIHGRLWKQEPKVVSFWNTTNIVDRLKGEVIDFIKTFDDPKNFVYDTDKGIIDFEQFLGKKPSNQQSTPFNFHTLHTMAPSPEKKALQMSAMGDTGFGSRAPNYPDAKTRSKLSQSESFSFKDWMMLKENIFEGKAVIKYGPGVKVYAEVDRSISEYYRSLIPKYLGVNPQAYGSHITVVRLNKEIPTKMENWGKHEGRVISFTYNPNIKNDSTYYWLDAYSDEIGDIREELGLPRFRDDSSFGGIKRNEYHITIGNVKK